MNCERRDESFALVEFWEVIVEIKNEKNERKGEGYKFRWTNRDPHGQIKLDLQLIKHYHIKSSTNGLFGWRGSGGE